MKKFNEGLDSIIEGYGFHKTVTRERYPAKLKLSEEFINAFKEEFEPLFVKNETVNGIIGKTHGVNKANKPPKKPRISKFKYGFEDKFSEVE